MPRMLLSLAFVSFACALAPPASAQLIEQKSLSAAMGIAIAQTALDTCTKQGYRVSVHVVGRTGEVLVAVRGDGASPHTMENSQRKAYTARTFSQPSADFVKRLSDRPDTVGSLQYTRVLALGGGLPIKAGNEVVGAVGVSGSPGKDDVCSQAGIDKVADQLK